MFSSQHLEVSPPHVHPWSRERSPAPWATFLRRPLRLALEARLRQHTQCRGFRESSRRILRLIESLSSPSPYRDQQSTEARNPRKLFVLIGLLIAILLTGEPLS